MGKVSTIRIIWSLVSFIVKERIKTWWYYNVKHRKLDRYFKTHKFSPETEWVLRMQRCPRPVESLNSDISELRKDMVKSRVGTTEATT